MIDLSVPQSPVKRGIIELTGSYYLPTQTNSSPQVNWGMIFQMNGSVLVLPYSKGKAYQVIPGEDLISLIKNTNQAAYDAEKRVRVLDFSDPDQPKEISDMLLSDVRGVSRYFMNGRILYTSHFKNTDAGSEYYLSKVDFSDLSAPLQSASVNIPAPCIGTDSSGMYAFTVGGCCGNITLSSFRLEADKAELTDKAEIEGYYNSNPGTIIISDGFAYLDGSGGIVIADLSNPEKIGLYEYQIKDGENRSISIYSVKNRRIFAYSGSGVIDTQYMVSYDASNLPSLRLDSFFDRTGINIYRFTSSNDNAYLSLGYYGLWISSITN
ncbi:MAG: hypothetical protein HC887_11645 [Desulfobacteraceae bacterium]|nr:hypothetical protein [Desulfobacteraceae bacterium]